MTRNTWIVIAVVAVAFVAVLVLGMRPSAPGASDVDNSAAQGLIADGVRVVDVRTTAEFAMGHIPGAENVPLDTLGAVSSTWDPAEPILLYCATGNRSVTAMDALIDSGFTSVYNLSAGIADWDGDVVAGADTPAVSSATPAVSGLPVMYEFYTDW